MKSRPDSSAKTCSIGCRSCLCALPPLRERVGDIRLLVAHYIDRYNREFRKRVRGLTAGAAGAARSVPLARQRARASQRDRAGDAARRSRSLGAEDFATLSKAATPATFRLPPEGVDLETVERQLVVQALQRAGGNQTQAGTCSGSIAIRFGIASRSSA